jgi:hypothetical protein
MHTVPEFQEHVSLHNELFQVFLDNDWDQFRNSGTGSVATYVRQSWRIQFAESFQRLTQQGCSEEVLFPCLFVFLNSQNGGVAFPWAKKFLRIQNALKKLRDSVQDVMDSPGFQTMEKSWLEPSLATFSDFVCAQRGLLNSAEKYDYELKFILKGLPARDVVGQYGRAVICTYVIKTLGIAEAHLNALLGCFTAAGTQMKNAEMSLNRDLKEFQRHYPEFCEYLQHFLRDEHSSAAPKLPVLNWKQFEKSGIF